VILGDDADKLRDFNPRTAMENMIMGDEPAADTVSLEKNSPDEKPVPPAPKPLGRGEQAPYDFDAT
jgi:hypothetical protein